ncbi:ATP-grasp fold amidoligase family protein [Oricola sp.]|uniref:ATP-grasp fold amidoligase family protein n=1 Tax=Oricola sp. TaxID=1979950 RepID=UPI0025EE6C5D|nr:ATP-grasp fold amidoligase family protein [Oricola sp.]MCI5077854.1 hypothetical protein [Oricola sp.]
MPPPIFPPDRRPPFDAQSRWINLWGHVAHARAVRTFRKHLRYLPNIAFPTTYHEKMLWRRVFDHDPAFARFCDKLETKSIFAALDPPIATAPTLWTGTDPRDLPDDLFGPGIVVKCNAGSRRNWFAGEAPDRAAFEAEARRWMAKPFGTKNSEWAYRSVDRRIYAERMLAPDRRALDELKIHMIGGEVYFTVVYREENTPTSKSALFDADGRRLAVRNSMARIRPERRLPPDYRLPDCYPQALAAARTLARGRDYVRVDFFVIDGRLHGGEITVYPTAGLMTNSHPDVIADMSRRWDLRRSWFCSTPQMGWRENYRQRLVAWCEARFENELPPVDLPLELADGV